MRRRLNTTCCPRTGQANQDTESGFAGIPDESEFVAMSAQANAGLWGISRGVALVSALLKQAVRENHGESLNTRDAGKQEKDEVYGK